MLPVETKETLTVPLGVDVTIKGRNVIVKGPRGVLQRSFNFCSISIKKVGNKVTVRRWFANRKEQATVITIVGHISNMIKGVTKGYKYKMRSAYSHFPINCTVQDNGKALEIRNFLGEKVVRRLNMLPGVTVSTSKDVKDELVLEGNSINDVSQSAASIHQSVLIRHKDIRCFLDGIYVSEKTTCD